MKKWVFLLVALLLLLSPLMGGCGGKKHYDLTMSVSPSGGGITSPAVGTHEYDKDEVVSITATPSSGWKFVSWSGASGTTAATTVTMDANKSVTATFAKITYTLTIAKVGNGTTNPAVGTHPYDAGTEVSITATPDSGSKFDSWSGAASGASPTTSVIMISDKTVTANFSLSTYTLTMAKVGTGGTIVPDVGAHTENAGATVNLTATADSGWQFVNWTGDVATVADVNDATTTVTMNGAYTITAHFVQLFTLNMAKVGTGTIDPAAGAHTENAGAAVNLTATPADGWQFVNWTGDVATVADVTDATTTVTMNGNYTITANFSIITYTLTMAKVGSGTIDPAAGAHTENAGAAVNLTATPADGWQFDSWSGDVATVADVNDATTTVTMNGDYTITAHFSALVTYTLTMNVNGNGTTDPAEGDHVCVGGTVVNITATPDEDWYFVSWTGDVADPNSETTTVTVDADKTVTANFSDVGKTLTMDVDGSGTTTPAAGDHVYGNGRVVSITAIPADGWKFVEWTGDTFTVEDLEAASTTMIVDGEYYIIAVFTEKVDYVLTLDVDPAEGGTTSPTVGDHTYQEGTVVTITATAASGWKFVEWAGDVDTVLDVNAASTTFTVDGDYYIVATFVEAVTYTLTMAVDDPSHGTTNPSVGDHVYVDGEEAMITANPDTGWQFDSWTGDVADPDATTTTVTMDADKTVTANFVESQGPTNSQWVYKVTYGAETTWWTLDMTAEEAVGEVTGESLGTGNGTQKVFGPTANTPILPKTEIVRLAGIVQSPLLYTMDYNAGTVTFNTAPGAGKAVTIDYSTSAFGVDCFKAVTTYSSPPARSASGYAVTISGSDTWRSQDNLAQYKAIAAITMFGSSVRTNMTDTFTGTPDFFTVDATWTMAEHGVLAPPAAPAYDSNYSVTVVGMESVTVEAGTFNCYKVEYRISGVLQKTEWWSLDVMAFVKQVDVKTYAQTQTMELTSFTLV